MRVPSRKGFSLVELGVSTAMVGVLMISMASVVVLASKAIPSPAGASENLGGRGVDQLLAELRCATEVTTAAAAAVTFEVADQDDDGSPEVLQYTWAGPGTPLLRSRNGSTPAAVTAPLHQFGLEYGKRKTTTSTTVPATSNSGEVLFSSFTGWSGLSPAVSAQAVNATTWAAERFAIDKVSIPADATAVRITRIALEMRRPSSPNGTTFTIGIHRPEAAGSSIPAPSPLGTPATLPVSSLTTSYAWVNAAFSDVQFTDPAERHFVIVVKGSGTSSGVVRYLTLNTAPLDEYFFRYTTNSGSSWSPTSNLNAIDAPFFVYGTYDRTVNTTTNVDSFTLSTARVMLQAGPGANTRVDAGVDLLNKPPVPGP